MGRESVQGGGQGEGGRKAPEWLLLVQRLSVIAVVNLVGVGESQHVTSTVCLCTVARRGLWPGGLGCAPNLFFFKLKYS